MMHQFLDNSYLFGGNAPFVEDLYEKYLEDPSSVPEEWRGYFDKLQLMPGAPGKDVAHAPVVESFALQDDTFIGDYLTYAWVKEQVTNVTLVFSFTEIGGVNPLPNIFSHEVTSFMTEKTFIRAFCNPADHTVRDATLAASPIGAQAQAYIVGRLYNLAWEAHLRLRSGPTVVHPMMSAGCNYNVSGGQQ